jgi:hypothetical protein
LLRRMDWTFLKNGILSPQRYCGRVFHVLNTALSYSYCEFIITILPMRFKRT